MARHEVVAGAGAAAAAGPAPGAAPGRGFYERALADPAFLARFGAAYEGDDDALDALWWLDHPAETAPSGAPAPAALARAARRALYGPGTDPAALERYELAAATAERAHRTAVAALGRLPSARLGGPSASSVDPSPPPAPAVAAARRTTPAAALGVALLVVAAVCVAAGFGLGRAVPVPSVTPTLTEHFQQTVTGTDATSVFGRAPEPGDLLGGELAPLDPVTLRRLVTVGSVRILAGRTTGEDAAICLIAADGTERLAARCVSRPAFARAGVTLQAADGLPPALVLVRWQPDGRLVWRSPLG